MTDVDELKGGPDCGNATAESEKDAEFEKLDYIDEDANDMDKLRLSMRRPWAVWTQCKLANNHQGSSRDDCGSNTPWHS